MENLKYYELLRSVPEEAQKSFNNGKFSGTDINPMWRIKKLTEVFGACGIGWYYEVVHRGIETASDNVTMCAFIGVNLRVKIDGEWSMPIYGEGGNTMCTQTKGGYLSVSDEAYKMALTDAVSNAAKQLGCGADIWFANDKQHSTKYDLQQERKAEKVQKPATPDVKSIILDINKCTTIKEVTAIWNMYPQLKKDAAFKEAIAAKGTELKGGAA